MIYLFWETLKECKQIKINIDFLTSVKFDKLKILEKCYINQGNFAFVSRICFRMLVIILYFFYFKVGTNDFS